MERALLNNDVLAVGKAFDEDPSLVRGWRNDMGYTAAHVAAMMKHWELVVLCLERGALIDAVAPEGGETILLMAAVTQNVEALTILLHRGASTTMATVRGWTALMMSCTVEMADILLAHGARVTLNYVSDDGKTAMHYALSMHHGELAIRYLEAGADPLLPDHDGMTPVELGMRRGFATFVDKVMEAYAGVLKTWRNKRGKTLLMIAVVYGSVGMVEACIDLGIDMDATDHRMETCVFQAVHTGSIEALRLLASRGADVTRASSVGVTPLMLASCRGSHGDKAMEILLSTNKSNMDAVDIHFRTALHQAASMNRERAIRLLLSAGASPAFVDDKGMLAKGLCSSVTCRRLIEEACREPERLRLIDEARTLCYGSGKETRCEDHLLGVVLAYVAQDMSSDLYIELMAMLRPAWCVRMQT